MKFLRRQRKVNLNTVEIVFCYYLATFMVNKELESSLILKPYKTTPATALSYSII